MTILQSDTLSQIFDVYFKASVGVMLNGNRVGRWYAVNSLAYFDQYQVVHQPRFIPSAVAYAPALRFDGWQFMNLMGFEAPRNPHTIFIVCKPNNNGFIFNAGGAMYRRVKRGQLKKWQVIEIVENTNADLSRSFVLGANQYGVWDFFSGDVAFIGYVAGIFEPHTTRYIHETLSAWYNIQDN
jgi:hypothetical protein